MNGCFTRHARHGFPGQGNPARTGRGRGMRRHGHFRGGLGVPRGFYGLMLGALAGLGQNVAGHAAAATVAATGTGNCPLCDKHCPLDALSCPKGRRFAAQHTAG
jgi:hypothetical protein